MRSFPEKPRYLDLGSGKKWWFHWRREGREKAGIAPTHKIIQQQSTTTLTSSMDCADTEAWRYVFLNASSQRVTLCVLYTKSFNNNEPPHLGDTK